AVDNVNISNITMTNTCNAIFIRLGHRNRQGPVGSLRNVTISDVTADIPNRPRAEMNKFPADWQGRGNHPLIPSSITGLPAAPVRDITLRNVSIVFGGIGSKPKLKEYRLDNLANVPENAANYPSCAMFGNLPAWGGYMRHAEGIQFENVRLTVTGQDFRPALVLDDVRNFNLKDSRILPRGGEPVILLKDVSGAVIQDTPEPAAKVRFIETLGDTHHVIKSSR
ncbi:MAG: glycoside hydrolase family 28 protein, partial [Verrucomicrobia bacterium]|nr:glycoside hydrolase family 28 protein [Verrucomicrobiota bacterium]